MEAKTKINKGSILPVVIAVIAIGLTIALFVFMKNGKINNPFSKPVAYNPCLIPSKKEPAVITISSTGITPSTVMICQEQSIKWVNSDNSSHKLVSLSKGQDAARVSDFDAINPQETVTAQFDRPETIEYSASPKDPRFKGEIIVR